MEESKGINFFVIIFLIIIICVIVAIIYGKKITETTSYIENTEVFEEENIQENINIDVNEEKKIQDENEQNDVVEETTIIGEEEALASDEEQEIENVDESQEAIELVKEDWGEDDSVYYRVDSIERSIYKISIRSNETTKLWAEYTVDMKDKKVTLDNIY